MTQKSTLFTVAALAVVADSLHTKSKSGQHDKRCMMEAGLEGRQPIAVAHQAATLEQAVDGAAEKLTRLVESTLDRLHRQARHRTDPPPPGPPLTEPS